MASKPPQRPCMTPALELPGHPPFGHHRQGAGLWWWGPGDPSCEEPAGTWALMWAWAPRKGGGLIHSPGAFVWLLLWCHLCPAVSRQGFCFTLAPWAASLHTLQHLWVLSTCSANEGPTFHLLKSSRLCLLLSLLFSNS